MHIHRWKYLAPASVGKKMAPERICLKCGVHHYRIRQFGEWTPWIEHPSWRMHVPPPTVHDTPPEPPYPICPTCKNYWVRIPGSCQDRFHWMSGEVGQERLI